VPRPHSFVCITNDPDKWAAGDALLVMVPRPWPLRILGILVSPFWRRLAFNLRYRCVYLHVTDVNQGTFNVHWLPPPDGELPTR
jgi:hypothetical protein